MIGYKAKLERDLARWQQKGLIDGALADDLRKDVEAQPSRVSLPGILATLGAVLLAFAAMTFVAANWQEMSKLLRLAILFGALWAAYGSAWFLQRADMRFLSEAAILLASGLFGANIMLIAQIYHIDGNPPDAVLMWAVGVLIGGVVLQSRAALALSVLLFALWSWWQVTQDRGGVHWPYLIGWAACAIPILWLRWRPGFHLQMIALSAWVIGLGYLLEDWGLFGTEHAQPLVVALGLGTAATGVAVRRALDQSLDFGGPVVVYGLAVAFAGLLALQFVEDTSAAGLAILAVATLALVIGALFYGVQSDNAGLTRVAYLLFCIELLALYFKTLGTLLDTALFFMIAGLIVIALASVAWRLSRRPSKPAGAVSP